MRPITTTAVLAAAVALPGTWGPDALALAEPAVPLAGDLQLGRTVNGDTRAGVELGVWRNEFWRLPSLRPLDRVRLRLLAPGDSHYLCAYGPDEPVLGLQVEGSTCQAASVLGPSRTFRATHGPGRYLAGVAAAVDGPYRLRLERIQHHVGLRLLTPTRISTGAKVTVTVRGGAREPLTSRALRVRLVAEFADGRTLLLDTGRPLLGKVRLRVRPPADIPAYLYRDHPVTLRATLAPSRHHIGAASAPRTVRLG